MNTVRYCVTGAKRQERIPMADTLVWYYDFRLYRYEGTQWPLMKVCIIGPCKSTLFKLLTGLFFKWNWNWSLSPIEVTEEEVKIAELLRDRQKDYKMIKEAYAILKRGGREEVKEYLLKRWKLEQLRKSLQ